MEEYKVELPARESVSLVSIFRPHSDVDLFALDNNEVFLAVVMCEQLHW